jgi:D-alanyl-D-alanine carboxypeptidase
VIRPLHLHHTSYPTTERIPKPRARGYFAGNNGNGKLRDYTTVNPGVPRTAGAMISRRSDLRVWAKALATGRLLKHSTHRKQLQFRRIPNPTLRLGYGLGMIQVGDFIGHDGAIFGYSTSIFYLPRARATIVVEANKSTNFSQESKDIFVALGKYLFPNAFPR